MEPLAPGLTRRAVDRGGGSGGPSERTPHNKVLQGGLDPTNLAPCLASLACRNPVTGWASNGNAEMAEFLMNHWEIEYEIARMTCQHCRAMGDRAGLRRAILDAWCARHAIRTSDNSLINI